MSDTTSARSSGTLGLGCCWPVIYLVLKLSVPQFAAWSWWWLLLAPVPIAVEIIKAVLR